MIIRYRRYLQERANVYPININRINNASLFVPCRIITRTVWARPFIVFTLPCLGSC